METPSSTSHDALAPWPQVPRAMAPSVLKNTEQSSPAEFSTFTSAVCKNDGDFVKCNEELLVNCNGKVSKAGEIANCDDLDVDKSKVTGFAVFEKEWKDPRI